MANDDEGQARYASEMGLLHLESRVRRLEQFFRAYLAQAQVGSEGGGVDTVQAILAQNPRRRMDPEMLTLIQSELAGMDESNDDPNTGLLHSFWQPHAGTPDHNNEEQLRTWLHMQAMPSGAGDISVFVNASRYRDERARCVHDLGLPRRT